MAWQKGLIRLISCHFQPSTMPISDVHLQTLWQCANLLPQSSAPTVPWGFSDTLNQVCSCYLSSVPLGSPPHSSHCLRGAPSFVTEVPSIRLLLGSILVSEGVTRVGPKISISFWLEPRQTTQPLDSFRRLLHLHHDLRLNAVNEVLSSFVCSLVNDRRHITSQRSFFGSQVCCSIDSPDPQGGY